MSDSRIDAGSLNELPPGTGRHLEVGGLQIALFNVEGRIHALQGECCHQGAPLGEGSLDGTFVVCPWHGWRFDVATGRSPAIPAARQDVYEVQVVDDRIWVLPSKTD